MRITRTLKKLIPVILMFSSLLRSPLRTSMCGYSVSQNIRERLRSEKIFPFMPNGSGAVKE